MALDTAATAIFELGKMVISRVWKDPSEQAKELRLLETLRQTGDLAKLDAHVKLMIGQMEINKIEAGSKSIFIAGWRPFVGWSCGFSLVYVSIVEPIARFIMLANDYTGEFPVIDTTLTIQVLLGMLGIAGMRSFDKSKGVETNKL